MMLSASVLATAVWAAALVAADSGCDVFYRCTPKKQCEPYQEDLSTLKGLRKGSSEYKELVARLKSLVCNKRPAKVCCRQPPAAAAQPASTAPALPASDPRSPRHVPSAEAGDCGTEVETFSGFVRGGNATDLGEFPWMALLRRKKRSGATFWHCGGSLINSWYVLTAAHCGPVDVVRVGEWRVEDKDHWGTAEDKQKCQYWDEASETKCNEYRACKILQACQPTNKDVDCQEKEGQKSCADQHQDIPVAQVRVHPDYATTASGLAVHDLMLVKLARPAVLSSWVRPLCLPAPALAPLLGEPGHTDLGNGRVTAVGWGVTETEADEEIAVVSTAEQQKVELPVVKHEACAETWSGVGINITAELSLETHLCAGGEEGKDACKGDSGGPLIARATSESAYMLVGVVSTGTSNCGLGVPTVNTRASAYRQWIVDNLV